MIEEGKFTNKDGVYLVFEGFCGIFMKKKKEKPKIDKFGRAIETHNTEGDSAADESIYEEELK